jgi:hypothetical protein
MPDTQGCKFHRRVTILFRQEPYGEKEPCINEWEQFGSLRNVICLKAELRDEMSSDAINPACSGNPRCCFHSQGAATEGRVQDRVFIEA